MTERWRSGINAYITRVFNHLEVSNFTTAFVGAARYGYDLAISLAYTSNNGYLCQRVEDDALKAASSEGRCTVVRYLLRRGVNANGPIATGVAPAATMALVRFPVMLPARLTPLCEAALRGHEEVARLLLENGAEINAKASGPPALHYAVVGAWSQSDDELKDEQRDYVGLIAMLCAKGADVKIRSERGGPVLHRALRFYEDNPATMRDIIQVLLQHGAGLEDEFEGETALMTASHHWLHESAEYLLKCGADIHARVPGSQTDSFDIAISQVKCPHDLDLYGGDHWTKIYDILQTLLNHGAEMNSSRFTLALSKSCPHVIHFLLEADAQKQHIDRSALLMLWMELRSNWQRSDYIEDFVNTLIHHGANVDKANSKGTTPFIEACITPYDDKFAIIRKMARCTSDINGPGSTGKSVLEIIYEASVPAYDKFYVLWQLGEFVDPTVRRKYGEMMMGLAIELKHHSELEIREWVLEAEWRESRKNKAQRRERLASSFIS